MRIAIDVSQVVYGTGVSTYTSNLVRNLIELNFEDEYILFGLAFRRSRELVAFLEKNSTDNVTARHFMFPPSLADVLWNRLHVLPIERLLGKIDVFHSSDWTQPPARAFKITTVHDLVPIKFPKLAPSRLISTHKARLDWVKKEVDAVIVPSETTKKDVIKLGIKEARLFVIPEAPDPIYKPSQKSEIEGVKAKYRINKDYLIAVGVNPRKNTQRIISAFEKTRAGEGLELVIVGHPYSKIEPTRGVKILGHIEKSDLPTLYSGAKALVYPSIYEGFGLPILEAFSCNLPVVTSNVGSMKEIAGEAAALVDPYEEDSIVSGIKKVIKDKADFVKKGKKRVKEFSWKSIAEKTLSVYKKYNS